MMIILVPSFVLLARKKRLVHPTLPYFAISRWPCMPPPCRRSKLGPMSSQCWALPSTSSAFPRATTCQRSVENDRKATNSLDGEETRGRRSNGLLCVSISYSSRRRRRWTIEASNRSMVGWGSASCCPVEELRPATRRACIGHRTRYDRRAEPRCSAAKVSVKVTLFSRRGIVVTIWNPCAHRS
jgi:hypothetical protein